MLKHDFEFKTKNHLVIYGKEKVDTENGIEPEIIEELKGKDLKQQIKNYIRKNLTERLK